MALAGCGAPGEPTARHPVTPQPVNDLVAQQRGDAVIVSFTLPARTTDEDPLPAMPTVEIFRRTLPPGTPVPARPGARAPGMQLADTIPPELLKNYLLGASGRLEFPDAIDPAETARTPGELILYVVRTRLARGGVSADSNGVALPVYPVPEPIRDLRAMVTESAVLLNWMSPERTSTGAALAGAPTAYRIYRNETAPSAAAAAPTTTTIPENAPPNTKAPAPSQLLATVPGMATEYRDTNFAFGRTYTYSVRSVAQFGAAQLESADSNVVDVAAKDIFPPAVPQALVAVVVPAAAGTPAYVELTWSINTEPDFAGYAVYRSSSQDAEGERLNSELLPVPEFRDTAVAAGQHYFYRARAVDRAGNQSDPSAPVDVELPQ